MLNLIYALPYLLVCHLWFRSYWFINFWLVSWLLSFICARWKWKIRLFERVFTSMLTFTQGRRPKLLVLRYKLIPNNTQLISSFFYTNFLLLRFLIFVIQILFFFRIIFPPKILSILKFFIFFFIKYIYFKFHFRSTFGLLFELLFINFYFHLTYSIYPSLFLLILPFFIFNFS